MRHSRGRPVRLGTGNKLLLSAAAVGTSVALAVSGTYASFSASVSRGHTVTSGVPLLVLGTSGAPTNRLGLDAPGIAPGDVVQRPVDITNGGSIRFTSYTASSVATTSSLLDTDAVNGLQARIQRCSASWTESGTSPNFTYTCSGTTTEVLSPRRVIFTAVPLAGMASAVPGGTDHLLVTETLPTTADNSFQNLTSALTYTFNAA